MDTGAPIVRVLIALEHSLFRETIRLALGREPGVEVVCAAGDGEQALSEAERLRPDVAVLEVNLPTCDGIRATRLIRERVRDCRILVITDADDLLVLIDALEAGGSGYLTKELPLSELVDAIRAVDRGEVVVPPKLLGPLLSRLIHNHQEHDQALRRLSRLSHRQREVLALLAEGANNDDIAQALVISPQTARTHVQNVLTKLEVHSRLEAAAFVARNGVRRELAAAEG